MLPAAEALSVIPPPAAAVIDSPPAAVEGLSSDGSRFLTIVLAYFAVLQL